VSFLLDTNVISEGEKPTPNADVIRFLAETDESRLYLSVVTMAELHRGLALMQHGRRRERLADWVDTELPSRFGERLLPFVLSTAAAWGEIMAVSRREGLNLQMMDAMLAATALVHELTLVTRNIRDFHRLGLNLINPWEDG
jgi:predicted nucleic acid-binding protein